MLKRLYRTHLAPHLGGLLVALSVAFIVVYGRLLMATCRVHVITPVPQAMRTGPVLMALWHQQLVAVPFLRRPNPMPLMGLMSASKDGQLMQRVSRFFNITSASGSSHRRALVATLALVKQAKTGTSLFLTPDGPRGPARIAKSGAVGIAHMANLPVVPCAAAFRTAFQFSSWDNFRLPLPFSALFLAYAEPQNNINDQTLTTTLNTLSAQTAHAAGLDNAPKNG